jgi:beta-glucosidase
MPYFNARIKTALFCGLFLSLLMPAFGQTGNTYQNPHAPLEARVADLFGRMTQAEKLTLLSGTGFSTNPILRLGIPVMAMADAGQGVRGGLPGTFGPATLFPAGVTMASTWDPELVGQIGAAIGEEALNKGTGAQVLLGPAVNIQRSPLGGRNGEYFSEDPYLTAQMAVGYIQGMQSTGCAACIKHFVANNEEVDRGYVNVHVSERALREIYLPAFEAGVQQGHVWTLMSSYNQINGFHATANKYLLTDVLKKGWGFDGLVLSDWGAVHETVGVVNAGNDLEMPGPGHLSAANLALALSRGQITQTAIDDSVRRILRTIIRVGLLDGPRVPNHSIVNSPAHQRLTFEAASQGIVLLKNQGGLLPLSAARLHSIAVIGPAALNMQYGAAGSPGVQPFYSISPLDGIKNRVGPDVTINYALGTEAGQPVPTSALHGLTGAYFANRNLMGTPAFTRTDPQIQFDWDTDAPGPSIARTEFSVRWNGELVAPLSGTYTLSLSADDGCRLFLDGKSLIDHWFESSGATQSVEVNLTAGHAYDLRVEYFQAAGAAFARLNWTLPGTPHYQDAVAAAAKSDVAIVCVGTLGTEGEGNDRPSMALPQDQDALIRAVAAVNPRTIVVLNNGTPVLMTNWLRQVPGLIEAWFPGQEGGHALAAILFGDVNPSGKLPTTFGVRREDYPDYGHFPGVNGQVDYAEGIYVGYRHFDKAGIQPLFPFGFGLSYTTFRYTNLRLSQPRLAPNGTVMVRVNITNTGHREGAEVVELYVHDPHPTINKPVQELKGFQKVDVMPGQTRSVRLTLTPHDLAYCDVPGKQWKADAGIYDIQIGASSRDIRLAAPLRLTATYTKPIPFMRQDQLPSLGRDLAFNLPVLASSVQNIAGVGPQYAVDGNDGTRWSSDFSDPQWIAVDLGKPMTIGRVRLVWEDAYALAYTIQVSQDGTHWMDVYKTQKGEGGTEDIAFAPVKALWVRMYGTERATQFGYSLYRFEVYAPGKQSDSKGSVHDHR